MSLIGSFFAKDITSASREKVLPIINQMFIDRMPYYNRNNIKERAESFFLKHKIKLQKISEKAWDEIHQLLHKPHNELTQNDALKIFQILTYEEIDSRRRNLVIAGAVGTAILASNPAKAMADQISNIIDNFEKEKQKKLDEETQKKIQEIKDNLQNNIKIKDGYYILFSSNRNVNYANFNQEKLQSIKEYKDNVLHHHNVKIGNNLFIRTLIGPFKRKGSVDWKPLSEKMTLELNSDWISEEPFIIRYINGELVEWVIEIKPDLEKVKVITKKEVDKKLATKVSSNLTMDEIINEVVSEFNKISPYKHLFKMEPEWVKSMMWIESSFRSNATSWQIDRRGKRVPLAKGYMQMTDEACKQVFSEYGKSFNQGLAFFKSSECYDPYSNIFWGVRHFAWTIYQFLFDSTVDKEKEKKHNNNIADCNICLKNGTDRLKFFNDQIKYSKDIIYSIKLKYNVTYLGGKLNFSNVLKFGVGSYNSGPRPTKKLINTYGYDYEKVRPHLYEESRNHVTRFYSYLKENTV